ncbi:MAG: SMP-30/gluconolactonase/LRE family protein [Wenzhouxiangellaceae bacterium]|nr:SMP-30/gluconolactonase/LRE family protein [Wenzhouxiangellaceae bacterium]
MRLWILPAVAALAAAGYGLMLASDAGLFREVRVQHLGACRVVEGVPGPEDMAWDAETGFVYISSQHRHAAIAGRPVPGAIWRYRPGAPASLRNLTPAATIDFRPHGVSLVRNAEGRRRLFVINHPGGNLFDRRTDWPAHLPRHTVEVFDVSTDGLMPVATHADALIRTPNDIAAVDFERYYFTNDHGIESGWKRTLEDWLRRPWASVVYFDGREYRTVAEGLNYANGIALSDNGERVYVAETTRSRIREYTRDAATGGLTEQRPIAIGFGVDNLVIHPGDGALWLAGHVNLFAFLGHARDAGNLSPSIAARIDLKEGSVETVFMDDGQLLSGSSVAVRAGDYLLIGAVFSPHLVECRLGRG